MGMLMSLAQGRLLGGKQRKKPLCTFRVFLRGWPGLCSHSALRSLLRCRAEFLIWLFPSYLFSRKRKVPLAVTECSGRACGEHLSSSLPQGPCRQPRLFGFSPGTFFPSWSPGRIDGSFPRQGG